MGSAPGEWDSSGLAAKAADRAKAAEKLRPAFEERMRGLGYGSLALAHAFGTLTGPDTVTEAVVEFEVNARLERSVPVTLDFEVAEREPALPVGHALTITGVERHGCAIRITHEIRPPLSSRVALRASRRGTIATRNTTVSACRSVSQGSTAHDHTWFLCRASSGATVFTAACAYELVERLDVTLAWPGARTADHTLIPIRAQSTDVIVRHRATPKPPAARP